jgi:pyruvate dehydrogenase E1 component
MCAVLRSQVGARRHRVSARRPGFADTSAARRFFHVTRSPSCGLRAHAERRGQGETVQEAFDKYRIDDPTAVRGVKQEGGDA